MLAKGSKCFVCENEGSYDTPVLRLSGHTREGKKKRKGEKQHPNQRLDNFVYFVI
jgi:hypothetical protein